MKPAIALGPLFERDPEIPGSLPAYVDWLIDRWPEGTFREIHASGEEEEASYTQLQARSQRFLSALWRRGAKPGDAVILLLARASDFIAAAWACIRGGYTWIPWSSGKPFEREEVFAAGFRDLTGRLEAPWILACEITAQHFEQWPDLLERCSLIIVDPVSDAGRPLGPFVSQQGGHGSGRCLIATSGTSGAPKLASLPHGVLLNRYARNLKTAEPRKTLFLAPLHTISGLGIVLPSSDFTVYMHPARLATHPHEVFPQIAKLRIQWFGLSSYIAALLADAHENRSQEADLSSLTHLTFGSDYIVHAQVERLVRKLQACNAGDLEISFVYGMTECGPICRRTFSSHELADEAPESSRAAEVGDLLDGWQLRIVDDAGDLLEAEQVGHIEVWSEVKLFSGYPFDAAIQASAFRRDGWFRTGDMGLLRHGRLTITGRESSKLIAGSGNLSMPQIEASICDLPGLHRSMVMAASLRPEGKLSDELVILFVPETCEESSVKALRRQIAQRVAGTTNVRVRELIAASANDFHYTASGKLQRNQMLERYGLGEWSTARSGKREAESEELSELELFLLALWKRLLEIEQFPPRDVSFFALGGDSLASAELISCVESKFRCELPLEEFYRCPTINRLIEILASFADATRHPEGTPPREERHDELKIVHKIEAYVGSWQGTRLFDGGLIVGRNASGRKAPLFWVFQSEDEFQALARHLGPDQPLYGLRSLVNIHPVKDYTADRIQPLVDRYLWEMLAMPVVHPVLLGGNCQGAIVALALAKTMRRIRKTPALLVLMEWGFSYGPYSDPTLLIHGSESHTAAIYSGECKSPIDWRGDFPNHTVASTPGGHGRFFEEPNVEPLAFLLRQQFDAHASLMDETGSRHRT